jgi:hypothetical protein
MEAKLVTTEQAAKYLGGYKPNTLEGWRVRGEGPRFLKIGHFVRYSVDDLDAYLKSCVRTSTSDADAA